MTETPTRTPDCARHPPPDASRTTTPPDDCATPPGAADDAQLVYARVLEWGTHLGLAALIASFAAYVMGWLPAHVPMENLPLVWDRPVDDYLRRTGMPTGWSWIARLGEGDVATLIGIALLAAVPMLALLAVIPLYAGRRKHVYAVICVLELAVLVLAASAVLSNRP